MDAPRRVLFLTPDLRPGGATTQLGLLARHLPRDQFLPTVCVLGPEEPAVGALREAGVETVSLGWRHTLDPRPLGRLARVVHRQQPAVIHTWGPRACQAAQIIRPRRARTLVASEALPPRGAPGTVDGWLLGRAGIVTGRTEIGVERCRTLGLSAARLALLPPTAAPAEVPPDARARVLASLGLPDDTWLIVCVGPFTALKGFRNAIWTLDILRHVKPNLHLVLAGAGPEEQALRTFTSLQQVRDRVHFPGCLDSVAPLLAAADVVWVPSQGDCGHHVALEALQQGRPVIATDRPGLTGIIRHEETGLLVPTGDQAALARATRRLWDNPTLGDHLGKTGRAWAASRFSLEALLHAARGAYLLAIGSPASGS